MLGVRETERLLSQSTRLGSWHCSGCLANVVRPYASWSTAADAWGGSWSLRVTPSRTCITCDDRAALPRNNRARPRSFHSALARDGHDPSRYDSSDQCRSTVHLPVVRERGNTGRCARRVGIGQRCPAIIGQGPADSTVFWNVTATSRAAKQALANAVRRLICPWYEKQKENTWR